MVITIVSKSSESKDNTKRQSIIVCAQDGAKCGLELSVRAEYGAGNEDAADAERVGSSRGPERFQAVRQSTNALQTRWLTKTFGSPTQETTVRAPASAACALRTLV